MRLVCTLVLALLAPGLAVAQGTVEDLAESARQSLNEGSWEEARRHAEAALRLDGGFHEGLLLKALAYEGLGDIDLAEDYLFAYQEEARLPELPGPGQRLMDRLSRARRAEHVPTTIRPAGDPWPGQTVDPAPYRERCQEALKRGRCRAASAAATELVRAEPGVAEGFRLLGDAARCHDEMRAAALAYDQYLRLGGDDPSVRDLHTMVLSTLGTLVVDVDLPDASILPTAMLERGDGVLPPSDQEGRTIRFVAVPVGERLTVRVAGLGLQPVRQQLAPFSTGETRRISVAPEVVGLGTLVIGAFDPTETVVRVETPDQLKDLVPEERREITAGDFTITVFSDLGGVTLEQRVKPGGTVTFEPARHLPAGLAIARLPAGSRVTVAAESANGVYVERERMLPLERGRIDSASGLRLVPNTQIDSLIGGMAGVWVSHPLLGRSNRQVVMENGAWTGIEWDASGMEGAEEISRAWGVWQSAGAEQKKRLERHSLAMGILAGALVGGGAGLMAGAREAHDDAEIYYGLRESEGDENDQKADAWNTAKFGLIGGGSAAFAVGALSTGLSIHFGVKARKATVVTGAWDPWNIEDVEETP